MTITSKYQDTVTYGIYNQNDNINAIALKDGTLGTNDSQTWNPKNVAATVKIIFKKGLVQVAAGDVATSGTTELTSSGRIA